MTAATWVRDRLARSSPVEWWLLIAGMLGAWFNAEGNPVGQAIWLSSNVPAILSYFRQGRLALAFTFFFHSLMCVKGLYHAQAFPFPF